MPNSLIKDLLEHPLGHSKSLWMELQLPDFPTLKEDINVDVCIVGAGITGLTCAYTLLGQGKSVVVVDQDPFTGGQTIRTTAHLSWALDDRYIDLEKFFGQQGSKLAAESHSAAIDYIEKIVREEKIDCDFERVDGFLFVPPEDSKDILDNELEAIKRTGMAIEKIDHCPLNSSFDAGPALRFPKQGQFHIVKYLQGLIEAILRKKGKIFNHTHVDRVEDGSPCLVHTESGATITAHSVIMATCTPVNDRFFIHTKQSPYRTYVIAGLVPKGSVPKALYWDTPDPYHYIRLQKHLTDPSVDWLLIGGEDHKTGQDESPKQNYTRLEKWAKKRFPMMESIAYCWSGQVFEPIDNLAFIGRNLGDKHIYIATGDSGNGMTHGTIAGILLPDLILGKENPWKDLYEPSRKTLSAASDFIQENCNTAWQYRDWLTPGDSKKIDALLPKEGMIVRKGIKKLAVYKDAENTLHVYSAVCPHLGGCVRWNSSEKSWDCPCHGSRFDVNGNMITGPSLNGLCPYQEAEKELSK